MRTIAWCVLMLSLVGCQSGPRWFMRDYESHGPAHFDEQPVIESAPQPATPPPAVSPPAQPPKAGPNLTPPPQPAQKERAPYESSSHSRGWFGGPKTSQASRSKSSSRSTQTARRSPTAAPSTKSATQDESVKQLLADLEKTKREKAVLETKLSDESAKQTQQRLELEARLALLQEQMRQQTALQQVAYQQQQAAAMSRPMPSYAGPMISSGTPNPSMQMPFSSSTQTYAPQPQSQSAPVWSNSAPTWNTPLVPQQQQVEQWPFSAQRR